MARTRNPAVAETAASFVADAWASFRRNGLMTAAAVTTITVALLVVGTAVLVGLNLEKVARAVEGQVQVVAFLRDGLPPSDISRTRAAVAALPGVRSVRFVGRDAALERLRKQLGGGAAFADLVSTNPLPDSLELTLADPKQAPAVARAAAQLPGISDVGYGGEVVDRLLALTRGVRVLGAALTLFLTAVALVVVVSTIRLTIIARRREIEIMQLVGATRWFVRWPFLIEGVLQGMAAGALASAVLASAYALGIARVQGAMPFLPAASIAEAAGPLIVWVMVTGVAVGGAGSLIAIRRFLAS
ncbi:MAG: permease-like cell division protein FtsX [Armatimonadota bacterium]|nr:permease-like cell division protein FtsX [Armatimonadota bacterium]MDR7452400.1 permease-like cell division protein FtsX [Armatimonadota bacterium]MDR7466745.1 permease-like cell division protein FtsX [Armatimonadota bacterium]MDR7492781.1 permease-like cell division protein FtsX [Armatimonadota bacterium]MDR7498557.1 permease-like cell division protein FtsX [Armatimonadota bacterium]